MAMTSNKGGGVFSDINITPLTDIFLVLLIIFMVTTAVTIESHQIYVNDKTVTEPELVPTLHAALQNSTDKIVVFQGDPKVILGDMVRILDLAKSAGAEAIAIAVSSLPPGGAPAGGTPGGGV